MTGVSRVNYANLTGNKKNMPKGKSTAVKSRIISPSLHEKTGRESDSKKGLNDASLTDRVLRSAHSRGQDDDWSGRGDQSHSDSLLALLLLACVVLPLSLSLGPDVIG
ncbi:hypothetical protein HZ326_12834 [Fusarium oxysporum f. sp. albedinis]|nr:hypothetical protein HZ326_12834 [Fusarium oxysporum f. sp. albedinis]